jgi:hypothetical protein
MVSMSSHLHSSVLHRSQGDILERHDCPLNLSCLDITTIPSGRASAVIETARIARPTLGNGSLARLVQRLSVSGNWATICRNY